MKKAVLFFILSTVLFSCKSKKNLTDNASTNDSLFKEIIIINDGDRNPSKKENLTYLKAVNDHYALNKNFNTLQINADIEFKNKSFNESLSADIRIQKGETILISIKKFGFTGAKILITPKRVSYYEILNGTFYDGDFEFISNFLGTNLDYNQIENLLLGTSVFNLAEEELTTKVEDGLYKLYKNTNDLSLVFVLDGLARMKQEVIQQKDSNDKLVIDYLSYQNKNDVLLPLNLLIRAIQKDETNLNINYKKIDLNPNISFPYKIPNGSKEINFN